MAADKMLGRTSGPDTPAGAGLGFLDLREGAMSRAGRVSIRWVSAATSETRGRDVGVACLELPKDATAVLIIFWLLAKKDDTKGLGRR